MIDIKSLYPIRHGHISLDEEKLFKTSIYNAINKSFRGFPEFIRDKLFLDLYVQLYGGFLDEAPTGWLINFKIIKDNITQKPESYSLGIIECIGRSILELNDYQHLHESYDTEINEALKKSGNKYTYLLGYITNTFSPEDQQSIQSAISEKNDQSSAHLERALAAFSTSENDYDLCVRESINAVEYIAKKITGTNSLDKSLHCLTTSKQIHPTLSKSLMAMYDYTSNTARHSTNEEWIISEKDSRFVFLSSCAWVAYLRTQNSL